MTRTVNKIIPVLMETFQCNSCTTLCISNCPNLTLTFPKGNPLLLRDKTIVDCEECQSVLVKVLGLCWRESHVTLWTTRSAWSALCSHRRPGLASTDRREKREREERLRLRLRLHHNLQHFSQAFPLHRLIIINHNLLLSPLFSSLPTFAFSCPAAWTSSDKSFSST